LIVLLVERVMPRVILMSVMAMLVVLISSASVPARAAGTVSDPWESLNRKTFAFNEFLDRNFLKPAAKGYQAITPEPVDTSVTNFFSNLREVPSFVNHLAQARPKDAAADAGRFILNTTVGVLGLFDVASKVGIEQKNSDFGLTLGRWGIGSGPYLVLPFLGPSTVRDAAGQTLDVFSYPVVYLEAPAEIPVRALEIIDGRADLLETEKLITGDRYTFLRNLYVQRRQFLLGGKVAEPSFDDEFDDEEF
jgi:phospholipid-binding lipoprotein MlaA